MRIVSGPRIVRRRGRRRWYWCWDEGLKEPSNLQDFLDTSLCIIRSGLSFNLILMWAHLRVDVERRYV